MVLADLVGDGVHQVGLAQTGGAVDEQGVVVHARLFCHGGAGSVGELVGAAHDEGIEGVFIVCALEGVLQLLVAACDVVKIRRRPLLVRCRRSRLVFYLNVQCHVKAQNVEKCLFEQGLVVAQHNGTLEG